MQPRKKHSKRVRRFNDARFKPASDDSAPPPPSDFYPQLIPCGCQERRLKADTVHHETTRIDLLNSLLSLLVISCAYLGNEAEHYGDFSLLQASALRVLIAAVSMVQIFLTIKGTRLHLELTKLNGDIDPRSTA